jgi:hypothetical protein
MHSRTTIVHQPSNPRRLTRNDHPNRLPVSKDPSPIQRTFPRNNQNTSIQVQNQ